MKTLRIILSTVAVLWLGGTGLLAQETSRVIPFNGVATSLPPGTTQDVTVQLWDAATGGNLLFAEAQTGLAVDDSGFINFAFGSQTAGGLNPTNFPSGTSRFLDVVDASSASVLAARLPLNATPFALSPGPAGPAGPPGPAGPAGPPGPPGVVQAVTAGDPSIAIGGSAANPTVAVAANGLTNAHLAANAAISPAKIAGTAATLGANLFTGPQQINNALGIGTSPLFPLHVRGDGLVQARIQSTNNTAMLVLDSLLSPTNWILASTGGGRFAISSSNSVQSRLSIDSQGNVGINTDTPTARLQVVNLAPLGTAVSGTGNISGVIGTGFFGVSGNGTGTGSIGVIGTGTGVTCTGVRGTGTGNGSVGVRGEGTSTGVSGEGITGVRGTGTSNGVTGTGTSIGVLGIGSGTDGTGVYGIGSGRGIAVVGIGDNGLAGYFRSNVQVTGTLNKGGGSFKIDHPLDPDNQYLYHSFVESPDMMNLYNGVAVLDARGEATVTLPEWFEALNRDFRYQLTCIGGFAPVYIAEEIAGNRFKIAGGQPALKVSWQVTGIRQDAWANAHRIPVEEDKPAAERGFYLHPDVYGQPEEKGIVWAQQPEVMRQMKAARQK